MNKKKSKPVHAWSWREETFKEKHFQPYALAIGQVVMTWNHLHEVLGSLFLAVMGGGNVTRLAAVWSSATTDRAKREMLRAAAEATLAHNSARMDDLTRRAMRLAADIKWMLNQINALEDARNNVVHAPLRNAPSSQPSVQKGKTSVVSADHSLSNARASRIYQKDLLKECRWCRDYALVLRNFAIETHEAWMFLEATLPERPRAPVRRPKNKPLAQHPPRVALFLPRPALSFRE